MARQPVHLTADQKRPSGRQAMWQAIRRLGVERFSLTDVTFQTGLHRDTVRSYLRALTAGGYLVIDGTVPSRPSQFGAGPNAKNPAPAYRLVRDVGIEAPRLRPDGTPCRQGAAREQLWRTMRLIATAWTPRELAVAASTEDVPVSATDALDYVKHLHHAGYLQVVEPAPPRRQARYRLTRATGPRPPMVQRLKTVWDPNLGKIMWQEAADA